MNRIAVEILSFAGCAEHERASPEGSDETPAVSEPLRGPGMPLRGQDFDQSCSIDHPKSNLIHQNKNSVEATTHDNEVALHAHVCIQKRSPCSSLSHLVLQAVEMIC